LALEVGVFRSPKKAVKSFFCRGFATDPAQGAYDDPPHPLVGWGGGYPHPILHPIDAFGVSFLAPSALSHLRTFGTSIQTPKN